MDGRHPLPNQDPRKGQNRDEPAGAGLQYEANDQYLRRQPADVGDRGLTARACRREPPLSPNTRIENHVFTRPRSRAISAERTAIGPSETFASARTSGR